MILCSRSPEKRFETGAISLSLISILLVAGCSPQDAPRGRSNLQPAELARAQKMYAELCAACHGSHARGAVGPDLTVTKYKYGKNRVAIEKSILDGRQGGMPAFGSHLKPDDAAVLADYLLLLQ